MQLIISLIVAVIVAVAGRNVLKAHPTIIYVIAVLVDILAVTGSMFGASGDVWRVFYSEIRRGILSFGFIMVVMFIGCFKNGSAVKKWLLPVRAELSIVSMLLMIPHVVLYIGTYNGFLFSNLVSSQNLLIASYALAVVLTVLFAVLGIMSFRIIRNKMNPRTWKRIQRAAYPFFVLILAHVFLARLRPIPNDPMGVLYGMVPYLVIVAVYVVWRIVRAVLDKKAAADKASVKEQ